MKITIIVIVTIVLTVLLLGGGSYYFARSNGGEIATTVRLAHPLRGDLVEVVSAPGEVDSITKVSLSAKVTARITELPYKEGDAVVCGKGETDPPKAASILVRLDDKDLQANLRSAESRLAAQAAELEVARVRLDTFRSTVLSISTSLTDAKRSLDREKKLLESRISSQSTVDQLQTNVDKLTADLKGAEHTLRAQELNLVVLQHTLKSLDAEVFRCKDNLAYTVITSPINGVVTRIKAQVGELAVTGTMNNPGTEILQVADLDHMLLIAQVDESNIASVKPGQKAKVRIQAYGEKAFDGKVLSVALVQTNSTITRTKYFETKILLDTKGERIYGGLSGDADIEINRHCNAMKIPSQAVVARPIDDLPPKVRESSEVIDSGKTMATVVFRVENGRTVITPVKIGPADSTHTCILSGLTEKDQIVVGPYKVLEQIRHDQKVVDERQGGKNSPAASQPASSRSSEPATAPARPTARPAGQATTQPTSKPAGEAEAKVSAARFAA